MSAKTNITAHARVGERLRTIRKGAGLSIKELGTKAAVSNGMISQIERGLTNPSIKTLERLHRALSVPLAALLEDETSSQRPQRERDIIRRADDRPLIKVGTHGITKELLTPSGAHDLQFMIVTVPAGVKTPEVLIGNGEKAGWILEGRLNMRVGDSQFQLQTGDSVQFPSSEPHSFSNDGSDTARMLWIIRVQPTDPQI